MKGLKSNKTLKSAASLPACPANMPPSPPDPSVRVARRGSQGDRQMRSVPSSSVTRYFILSVVAALTYSQLVAAQVRTTLFVNPTSSAPLPNGSQAAPFPSLGHAWASLVQFRNPNVTFLLAQGTYTLPLARQLHLNGSASVFHAPQTASGIVKIVPDPLSAPDSDPQVRVTDQAVVQFRGVRFSASSRSTGQPTVAMVTAGSGSLKFVSCTLESDSTSTLSLYQLSATAASSIVLDSVTISASNFELNAQDSAIITVRSSTLIGTRAAARALFFGSGTAQLNFASTVLTGVTGSVLDVSGASRVTWDSNSLSQVSCGSAQLSVANIRDQAEVYMSNSNITDVSTAQAQTCVGGLFGLYDQSYLSIQSSLLSNLVGRLVYADGNGLLVMSDRTRLASLTELDIAGQSSAQYLGSMRGNAQVQFTNTALESIVGSWIATDSSVWELTNTTLIDNVCPPSKSFWASLAGSASLTMTRSTFKSRDKDASQLKACTVALMTDDTRVNFRQSEVSQYVCRSSCIDSLGQSLVTMEDTTLCNLTSTNRDKPLVSLSSPRDHTFTRMNVTFNSGPAASVLGILGTGDQVQSVAITDSFFSDNTIPAVLVGFEASSVTVTSSNFTRNAMAVSPSVLFSDASTLVNRGTCSVTNCLFTGNSAKYGGAIYHDGPALTISDTYLTNNHAALDGGALYLSSPATMTNLVLQGNRAKRGGGWFTVDQVALAHTSSNLVYASNVPSNYASTFHAIQLGPASASLATNGLSVTSGAPMNASIEVRAEDAFGQPYTFGGRDRVLLLQAHVTNVSQPGTEFTDQPAARLTGESTQALFRGSVTFRGLQVYGAPFAAYALRFSRVLASGALDPGVSVAVPLTIHACPPGQFEHASTVWGPDFPVCAAPVCPQGCTRGTCVSAGNCACAPGWEGIACDEPSGAVDSLSWMWSPVAFPVVSVGVRDALATQVQLMVANVSDGRLTAQVRRFEREGGAAAGGKVVMRFTVVDVASKQAVQARALAEVNTRLLDAMARIVDKTVSSSARAVNRDGSEHNTGRFKRSPTGSASSPTTTSSSTTVFGYAWPPSGFATPRDALLDALLVSVPKQVMSPAVPTGAALVALHLLSISVTIALWGFLVVSPTGHFTNIVRASSRIWLTWFSLGVCLVHLWMVTAALPPTDAVCRAQVGMGAVAVAVLTGAVTFKAAQLWVVCENPILVKSVLAGSAGGTSSSPAYRGSLPGSLTGVAQDHGTNSDAKGTASMLGLSWVGSGLLTPVTLWFLANLILISCWLSSAAPLISATVSYSLVDGSYWHCTLQPALTRPPSAWLYYLLHMFLLLFTLVLLTRVRAHGATSSPSQEPRIVAFVTVNLIAAFCITGAVLLVSGGLGVVTQYLLAAFAMLLALGVSTAGVLGFKVHLVVQANKHRGIFEFSAAVTAAAAHGGGGNNYQLAAVKRALDTAAPAASSDAPTSARPTHLPVASADDESILCVLDQSSILASSLVPIRLLPPASRLLSTFLCPSPWRVAFVEIAKEYRYLSVAVGNEPARFFGLPCTVEKVDQGCCVLSLKFKSGTRMQVQARDQGNLREWVRVMEVTNAVAEPPVGLGDTRGPGAGTRGRKVSLSVGTPLATADCYSPVWSSGESVDRAPQLPALPQSRSGGTSRASRSAASSQQASRRASIHVSLP